MKKGLKKTLLHFIFFAFLMIMIPKNTYALTFRMDRSPDTVKPGGEVTVYIKAEGIREDSLNAYTVNLQYDSSKLEYKSSTSENSNINPVNPIVITKGNVSTISNNETLATIVFGVKSNAQAGSTNLTLTSSGVNALTGPVDAKNITNISSMININALGTDASLSSLKIPNTTLTPKFDKNVTEYSADIKDITEITINAAATDSNAKIMISDNYKNLVKGENIIKISVTAENGAATKTYTIKVNLTMTPTEEEKLKASTVLKNIEVKDYDIDFSEGQKKFTLSVPYKVKKLSIKTEAENPNATIEIDGNKNFKVGKNTIKITVTSEDTQNTETYVITVTREKEEKKIVQTCPDVTSSREWIIFSVCMLVTFTLGIVLGFFLCKKEVLKKIFKKKQKIEKPETIDTLSDTIQIDTKKIKDKTVEKSDKKEEKVEKKKKD